MTLCGGESPPVSSLTFELQLAPNPIYDLRHSLEAQKGLQLTMASEDPAIDSELKAVSLRQSHSIFAHNTAPAASFEGSIMLCNDYRHASAPARSESWGVDEVHVDFTGLAIIRPHRSSPDRVRQCTPKVSGALTSPRNSSKPRTPRPGWARPRRPWLLGSQQRSRARDACSRPPGRLDRSEVRTAT